MKKDDRMKKNQVLPVRVAQVRPQSEGRPAMPSWTKSYFRFFFRAA
jgi:hypothetical protein